MLIEELIPQEIEDTPAAIQATLAETRPAAHEAARAIQTGKSRRIFIIGNGTSLYTSMAATYTARMLAGAGAPFVLAVPAGEFRYFMPAIGAEDVVVGMSASGEFRDVIAAFEQLSGNVPWSASRMCRVRRSQNWPIICLSALAARAASRS